MATYTFWKLLNEFPIEIPLIQRDYAQGREGAKASQIREKFVADLVTSLVKQNCKDLDFVYGSTATGKFVPLDGQQRLTTLFLFHWYLASESNNLESFTGNNSEIVRNILTRFSYETRTSSRDFCYALVTNPIADSDKSVLSEKIKECPWFFRSWTKDPTIKAMLVMLDTIQLHCKNQDFDQLWNNLISENSITFQYLNLTDFRLTDELYIKMNARGKALTDFENFKAWFGQLVEENSNIEKADRWDISAADWQTNMDKSWTDLFWRHKGPENHLIDEEFMQFFNGMALNHYVKYNTDADEEVIKELYNRSYYTESDYEKCGVISEQFVKEISVILNQLVDHDSDIEGLCKQSLFSFDDSKSVFQKFINQENRSITYPNRVRFFALSQFLLKNSGFDSSAFVAWGRVVRNIIENSTIDSAATFKGAITLVNELSENSNAIYGYIGSADSEIKSRFAADQVEEERIKANLILKSQSWEQAVLSIDDHKYFSGDIDFILNFAGISDYYRSVGKYLTWTDEEDKLILNSFLNYSEKAEAIFYEYGLRPFKDFIWERALLSKGDYTLRLRSNYSFIVNSDSEINWKRLLRNDSMQRKYVKDLFDEINPSTIESDLQRTIENAISSQNTLDWKIYFIKYPQIIDVCGWRKLIRFNNEDDILLLGSSTTSGYHKEYYSYALYLSLKENGQQVQYQDQKSVNEPKYIYTINGRKLRLYYAYENQKWQYVLNLFNDGLHYFSTQEEILTFLEEQNYFRPISDLVNSNLIETETMLVQEDGVSSIEVI